MIGVTEEEMKRSLAALELRCEGRTLAFNGAASKRVRIDLRVKEPHQLVYLARLVAHLGYDEIHFLGASLWVTAFGIWGPLQEAINLKTLEQFRRSFGENRSLESAPGNYFRHDEFVESVCCLLQPMLVGWDAFYVPTWAYGGLEYFVAVSHDSMIDIEIRTPEMYDKCLGILRMHDWIGPLIK